MAEEILLVSLEAQNSEEEFPQSIQYSPRKIYILWFIFFLCIILISGPLSIQICNSVPPVKLRNISLEIFSEERAIDYLINLTRYGSRVSNTWGNIQARDYLLDQIQRICSENKQGLEYEINLQNFSDPSGNLIANLLVRLSKSNLKHATMPSLMLSAHYDSVEFGPGAGDDGSGVVILLELLSNLINDLKLNFSKLDLIILFTNSEEMDLLGSQSFIKSHHWAKNIRRFINVDSVTLSEVASLIQLYPSEMINDYINVPRPRANVLLNKIPEWAIVGTDYDIYHINGSLTGYNFGFFQDGYTYHTKLDNTSFLREGVIQDLGENLGVLIRNLFEKDFEQISFDDSWIYFDIFNRYLIVYRLSRSILLEKFLLLLFLIFSLIFLLLNHHYHRQRSCLNSSCIYYRFTNALSIRLISIFIYSISNLISACVSIPVCTLFALSLSKLNRLWWFESSTLALLLLMIPVVISFISVSYLGSLVHDWMMRKYSKKSNRLIPIEINFDFERNFSVLIIYGIFTVYFKLLCE